MESTTVPLQTTFAQTQMVKFTISLPMSSPICSDTECKEHNFYLFLFPQGVSGATLAQSQGSAGMGAVAPCKGLFYIFSKFSSPELKNNSQGTVNKQSGIFHQIFKCLDIVSVLHKILVDDSCVHFPILYIVHT